MFLKKSEVHRLLVYGKLVLARFYRANARSEGKQVDSVLVSQFESAAFAADQKNVFEMDL